MRRIKSGPNRRKLRYNKKFPKPSITALNNILTLNSTLVCELT